MKLSYSVLTRPVDVFLRAIINLINDPLREARALPAPHYIAQFFVTFDDPNISRILSSESRATSPCNSDVALPRHAELPEGVYRFLPQLSRGVSVESVSRGLTILLLVLLPANCAGSPTPWRRRKPPPFSDRIRAIASQFYAFSRYIPFHRPLLSFYRFNRWDSTFYTANLAGCIPRNTTWAVPRARGIYADARRYRCALKPVSGAAPGQLCLLGPPGPFVVALPRLNLYKWVRGRFLSRTLRPSPFSPASISRSSSALSPPPPLV